MAPIHSWPTVKSGVPQGSVLGPLLFLIHVNDIHDVVFHSNTKLFTDDVAIYKMINTSEDCIKLQEDLNCLSSWADKWQLKLNASKCEGLLISRKCCPTKFDYNIRGTSLSWKPLVRYLGVYINSKLDWTDHCKITAAKATRCLNFLRHTMWSAPQSAKSLAYKSITRPIMEYGCQVWNPHHRGNIDSLERVQRRAARWTCGSQWSPVPLSWTRSSEACLSDLSWPTLHMRRQYLSIVTLYDILHKRFPSLNFTDYCTLLGTCTRKHVLSILPSQSTINAYRYPFFENISFPSFSRTIYVNC